MASLLRKQGGVHQYRGFRNSRAKRFISKLYKGMHVDFRKLSKAFEEIEMLKREKETMNGCK